MFNLSHDLVPHSTDEPVGIKSSRKLLERHTAELLGAAPSQRIVRIMVTLPTEAARDFGLVRRLVASGMDIARINCAHDGPLEWKAMAAHVRRAARSCAPATLLQTRPYSNSSRSATNWGGCCPLRASAFAWPVRFCR